MPKTATKTQFEDYNPIVNQIDNKAGYDFGKGGTMFETYGEEFNFVAKQPENNIWTLINGEGSKCYLIPGFWSVNRLGYFVTEEPWTDNSIEFEM